jgi:transposase
LRASEQDREDIRETRAAWRVLTPGLDAENLVFIDEANAKTNMARLPGWAPKGERAHDHAPHGHWCSHTMISALRLDGPCASLVVDGATDGDVFEAFVTRVLVPELLPGDIVVMDNLSVHKRVFVRRWVEACGARLLYLPAYSPDFNPIEQMWGKVKSILRKLAARTVDALQDAIAFSLRQITPEDARSFFETCGYDSS